MSKIVIIGGGIGGLASALLLARDGHQVTVLERDPAPPPAPAAAWNEWERRGVNQFRLPHGFMPRFTRVLEAELPDVCDALVAAGALRMNRLLALPESVTGGYRPGDERFDAVTARRPFVEARLRPGRRCRAWGGGPPRCRRPWARRGGPPGTRRSTSPVS